MTEKGISCLLDEVSAASDRLARTLEDPRGTEDLRSLVVEVMQAALEAWSEATGDGKADLARESELWRVYMTPDGYERTQTLDKYLDLLTVPRKPRVKTVVQTADFVLRNSEPSPTLRDRLEGRLARLRAAL